MGESDKKKKKNMYFIDSHGEIDPLYLILNTHTHTHKAAVHLPVSVEY